eukprot:gene2141-5171_t
MRLYQGIVPALTPEIFTTLFSAGIRSASKFFSYGDARLASDTNLSLTTIVLLREQLLQLPPFRVQCRPASPIIKTQKYISTGIPHLDVLLGGGLRCGGITQVFGHTVTGKTQLCLAAATTASSSDFQVHIIDSNGSYSLERIREVCLRRGLNENSLENIHVYPVCTPWDLIDVLDKLQARFRDQLARSDSSSLVIIDSLATLFWPYLGPGNRQSKAMLAYVAEALREFMQIKVCACVVVNFQIHSGGGKEKPALGSAWHQAPHTHIQMKRLHRDSSVVEMLIHHSAPILINPDFTLRTCRAALSAAGLTAEDYLA